MYALNFIHPNHSWTITASAELTEWLQDFAAIMNLGRANDCKGGRIYVARQEKGKPPEMNPGWKGFSGRYGCFSWKTGANPGEIRAEIPSESEEDWFIRTIAFKMLLIAAAASLPENVLLLHAATLIKNDEAILIAASSGGGKSTTVRRLPSSWKAPGDESCLLAPDSLGGYRVQVLPTWSRIIERNPDSRLGGDGLQWDTRQSYPVRALCILKQDQKDDLSPVELLQATVCLSDAARQLVWYSLADMDSAFRPWFLRRSFDAACHVAKNTPVYLLSATLEGKFWEVLEEALW